MSVTAAGVDYGKASLWGISMLCPRCGGDMDIVNEGRVYTREFTAMLGCLDCGAAEQLLVRLISVDGELRNRGCGTNYGYHRHRYLGEIACGDCRAAHSKAESVRARDRRDKKHQADEASHLCDGVAS